MHYAFFYRNGSGYINLSTESEIIPNNELFFFKHHGHFCHSLLLYQLDSLLSHRHTVYKPESDLLAPSTESFEPRPTFASAECSLPACVPVRPPNDHLTETLAYNVQGEESAVARV
mmetsp:Transcript_24137/g.58317  ORF Transcript_24137/g.58317 Transcript_24137/m.58317 type:complete len:116 (+) Transcript_24137:62-409(+)